MSKPSGDLSPQDIANAAARWYGLALPAERAEAIAAELSALNAALRAASARLRYDHEPGTFAGTMRDGRGAAPRD
jgi:hypothetical protein